MQVDKNPTESNAQIKNEISDKKQYLITDEKFQLLKECQQDVYVVTESSPSIRKIINELITEENLQKVTSKFIAIWNN